LRRVACPLSGDIDGVLDGAFDVVKTD